MNGPPAQHAGRRGGPMTRLGVAVAAIAAALLLAACSGDNSGSDATLATTTSTTVPATTAHPAVSSAPTTTRTTTAASATTQPPTTTVDELGVTKEAVAAAVVAARDGYLYAVRNYDAPDAVARLQATHAANSPSLQLAISNMETLRTNGWRSRPNPDVPDTFTVEGEVALLDGPPATRAEVTVCSVSTGIVYEPGGAPDGSDTIVNDEMVARRIRATLVLEGGAWKLSSGTNLGTWNGVTECPAE